MDCRRHVADPAMRSPRLIRGCLAIAVICALWAPPAEALSTDKSPTPEVDSSGVSAFADSNRQSQGQQVDKNQQIDRENSRRTRAGADGKKIEFQAPPVKWETKSIYCSSGGLNVACSATIIDCAATGRAPRIFYMRQEGTTQWYGPISRCGDGYPSAPDVDNPATPQNPPPPPTPTITQIREAFLALPFAKPSVSMQPVGNKTLIDLPTYYAAEWPSTGGLAPGDVSKPKKLLSWTIEFKIAAKDYRYDYGDGSTSGWTSSTGGTYPDGDVTHTYDSTGRRSVKVDARLVGEYRVNGGRWQDLGAVADLQDEPVTELQVVGTRTRLVS